MINRDEYLKRMGRRRPDNTYNSRWTRKSNSEAVLNEILNEIKKLNHGHS